MQFDPLEVIAQDGDTIRFMFLDSLNSAVRTTAAQPCTPDLVHSKSYGHCRIAPANTYKQDSPRAR